MTEPNTPEEYEEQIRLDREYLVDLRDREPHIWEGLTLISGFTAIAMVGVSIFVSEALPDLHMVLQVGFWVLTAIIVIQFYVLWHFEQDHERWAKQVAFDERNLQTLKGNRDYEYPPDTPDQ